MLFGASSFLGGKDMALFLCETDIARLLPMTDALDVVEQIFRSQGQGGVVNRPRSRVRLPDGTLHVMSAGVPDLGVLGLKAYTTFKGGARFLVLLYSAETGHLLAIMEADRLGQIRTGAASGVATKFMARMGARTVGVIGSGWQARSQLTAVCRVRTIDRVTVYSRTPEHRQHYCEEMAAELSLPVIPVESAAEAARDMDIVITITSAREPVLKGAWLSPGAHVNAAGSNALNRCEIDDEVVRRAALIVVDSKEQAQVECGDLLGPIERGLIHWDQVNELGDIVAGSIPGRRTDDEITLFESQGVAMEDIAVAARVYERAIEEGVGEELPL